MTYDEVKKLLEDIKDKKRLALRIKQEINTLRENYDILLSPLGNVAVTHSIQSSSVERLVERVEDKRDEFETTLQEIYDLEDILAQAIKTLTPVQQNIITGYYMQDKTHDKLAEECNYCERSIKYIKRRAIEKLARKL